MVIDKHNELYVTQNPGEFLYTLHSGDECLFSHRKSIYGDDVAEEVTVDYMKSKYIESIDKSIAEHSRVIGEMGELKSKLNSLSGKKKKQWASIGFGEGDHPDYE